MDIDSLTIAEAKQIAAMFPMRAIETHAPPTFSGRVIAQFIGRFVFVCNLEIKGNYCYLKNVLNLRYWAKRPNGLGDLAKKGPTDDDIMDEWPDQLIPLDKLGPVMSISEDSWK